MMAGGLLAFVKRASEARRAVLEAGRPKSPRAAETPRRPDRPRPAGAHAVAAALATAPG